MKPSRLLVLSCARYKKLCRCSTSFEGVVTSLMLKFTTSCFSDGQQMSVLIITFEASIYAYPFGDVHTIIIILQCNDFQARLLYNSMEGDEVEPDFQTFAALLDLYSRLSYHTHMLGGLVKHKRCYHQVR